MSIHVIVPVVNKFIINLDMFLNSFDLNCIDKSITTIYLIVLSKDFENTNNIARRYPTLKTNIFILKDLIKKYDIVDVNEDQLFVHMDQKTLNTIKKLYGFMELQQINNKILHLNAKSQHANTISKKSILTIPDISWHVCFFDVTCIFIRTFSLHDYICENKNKIFYWKHQQNNMKIMAYGLFDKSNSLDNILFNGIKTYIYAVDIVINLISCCYKMYHKLLYIPPYFDLDNMYNLYYYTQTITSHNNISLIDIDNIMKNSTCDSHCYLQPNKPFSMINNYDYEKIKFIHNYYNNVGISQISLSCKSINSEDLYAKIVSTFLLLSNNIKICNIHNKFSIFWDNVQKNMFNMKCALGVSGIFRPNNNLCLLRDLIYPMTIDTFFYIFGGNCNIVTSLKHIYYPKKIINDPCNNVTYNPIKIYNNSLIMIHNTYHMCYKKKMLLQLIDDKYDIIIQLRPDLCSLDGKHLVDILYDILKYYDDKVLYVPEIYNAYGITDTIAIGNINVMQKFLTMYDYLDELSKKYVFNPEHLTHIHASNQHIKIIPFYWDYVIEHRQINAWWRREFNITPTLFNTFIDIKSRSFESYVSKFFGVNKKYKLTNIMTQSHIFIDNDENITLNKNNFSKFAIHHKNDILYRVCFRLDTNKQNLNKDLSGWNLFSCPDMNKLCGKGNDDTWAQFYIYTDTNNSSIYYIATYHVCTTFNKLNKCNFYVGVKNNQIACDFPMCDEAQWLISEV